MKKPSTKMLLAAAMVGTLAATTGFGTYAKYVQTMQSQKNIIKSKAFIVSSKGTLEGDTKFNFTAAPGDSGKYDFMLDRSKVDPSLPIIYTITFETDNNTENSLFKDISLGVKSPIELNLYRYGQLTSYGDAPSVGGGPNLIEKKDGKLQWTVLPQGYAGTPNEDYFKLDWKWNENDDNDIKFQDKAGNVTIKVTATQQYQQKVNASVSYTDEYYSPFNGGKWKIQEDSYKSQPKEILLNSANSSDKSITIKDFVRNCDHTFKVTKDGNKLTAFGLINNTYYNFEIEEHGSSLELVAKTDSIRQTIYISGDYDTIQKWLK